MVLIPTVNIQSMTKEEFQKWKDEMDKTLSTLPFIVSLEKQVGIHKVHLAGVSTFGLFIFLLVFNNIYAGLLTDICGYWYPAYMSVKAVDMDATVQGQWLGYWPIFGLFQLIEYAIETVLHIFPFYYTFKLIIIVWLASPATKGASTVYELILKPLTPPCDAFFAFMLAGPSPSTEAAPAGEGGAEKKTPATEGGDTAKPEVAPAAEPDTKVAGNAGGEKKEGGDTKEADSGGDLDAKGKGGKPKSGKVKWGYVRLR